MEEENVTLEIEGMSVVCTKEELIAGSSYFEVMFRGNFVERNKRRIELKDVKVDSFLAILELLRGKERKMNYVELIQILTTASMLQFATVQNLCVKALNESLAPDNALIVWQAAEKLDLQVLLAKARYIALTEFETIRKTETFIKLEYKWLLKVLASRNLVADREINVFEAGMLWLANNENIADKENIAFTLLSCLDFSEISVLNLIEMRYHEVLKNFERLVEILLYILESKKHDGDSSKFGNDVIDKANILLNTKRRHRGGYPAFILHYIKDSQNETVRKLGLDPIDLQKHQLLLFYYDGSDFKFFAKPNRIGFYMVNGRATFSYKHLILLCGGEHAIGRETWLREIQVYNILSEKSYTTTVMPFLRRHFKAIPCDNIIYFIGGYGQYRTHQGDNMFWYDCETDEWSKLIMLPDRRGESILCCDYNRQLCLLFLSVQQPKAHFFLRETCEWKKIDVLSDFSNPLGGAKTMFSYNNKIFLKGKFLSEFELRDDTLVQISEEKIDTANDEGLILDYCVCDDTVYTLYERDFDEDKIFEAFSLITRSATNLPLMADHLFAFRHYNICENEEFINEYFTNCC